METKKIFLRAFIVSFIALVPFQAHAQVWEDLWNSVTSAFEDATQAAREALKPAIEIGGQTVNLGSDAIGAATQQALNAQTAAYGAAKSLNSKAFVYFRSAVPLPHLWDLVEKVSDNTFSNYEKLEQSRQAAITYGGAVAKRMADAAIRLDWKSIWDFANGMTGYLTIQPSQNCPRPLMAAIFVYNPVTNDFKAVSMNPKLTRGNLSFVYAAPRVELNYDKGTNPEEVNPADLFIGAVAQLDPKSNTVKWDYSGPCSVLQKSKWLVDYNNGEFVSNLVADDGNIDSKPEKSDGIVPKPDAPSSVNADMNNIDVPYCRSMDGIYNFPVDKGQIIRFGDIVTLESLQYNFYLDADDDMCRPLGLNDGIDKQWQIIDPTDCNSALIRTPVRSQQMIALKSVKYNRFLDADDNCVTANGGDYTGTDKKWWFVNPDNNSSNDYIKSGHVMGLMGNWKNRYLDADDNRCTADGNSLETDKQWRIQLHPEYLDAAYVIPSVLPEGVCRIRVKATDQFFHEDDLGDKLISTRAQPDDDFTRFILEKQPDKSYRIRVKGSGLYLHEDGLGDRLISTRTQPDDDFTHFFFEKQPDNSYKIRVKASCRYLHENGLGDRLVSTRAQPDDDFVRFYLDF